MATPGNDPAEAARMDEALDIHDFAGQFARAQRNMERSTLTNHNKELIRAYCDACTIRRVCGRVWLGRGLIMLTTLGRHLGKDFDGATRADFERVVAALHARQPSYRPETIVTFQRVLRRFMCYVLAPDAFPNVRPVPREIAWLGTALKEKERSAIKRSDLVTPDDVVRLLKAARTPRDRALISVLWESGARIGEIGNLRVREVVSARTGYTLDIAGKTGSRTPLVVSSAPHLRAWLRDHPLRTDPMSPLWVLKTCALMPYWTIAKMIKTAFVRADIEKRAHPHLFRHSRVTYVLANGIMNEQQAKVYFGWTRDSAVLGRRYAHLIDNDANAAVLAEHGLFHTSTLSALLRPQLCNSCSTLSVPEARHCSECGEEFSRIGLDRHRASSGT
jgi:integrase